MSSPAPPTPERPYVFLVRLSGELSIKAKATRNRFTNQLRTNLIEALEAAGIDAEVRRSWSRVFVTAASEEAGDVAARVFGVSSVSRVEHRTWEGLDDVLALGEEIFAPHLGGRSFAVRARETAHAMAECRPEVLAAAKRALRAGTSAGMSDAMLLEQQLSAELRAGGGTP